MPPRHRPSRTRRQNSATDAPAPERLEASLPAGPLAVILTVILALTAWAYVPGFVGVLALDDVRAIARNDSIRSLTTALMPPGESTVAGRPVANLSFAINYALAPSEARDVFDPADRAAGPQAKDLFLRNVFGYHLGNLLIHLLNALLLFGVARRTLTSEAMKARVGASATWIASAVTALWAVHPLTTAAVTYIVQRVESLMALWYLLCLYAAIRAFTPQERWPRVWAVVSIAASACGMATKEVMVGAPMVVALWDWTYSRERTAKIRRLLYGGLAATWLIVVFLVAGEHRVPSIELAAATSWRYLLTQSAVLLHYLRLVFVPGPLAFLYDWPLAPGIGDVFGPMLVVTGAFVATAWMVARRHAAGFAAGAWFLILAPTSSLLPIVTEVAAEHRMYLPLAAVLSLAVVAVVALSSRTERRLPGAMALVVVVVLCGGLAVTTRARNAVYADDVALWQQTVDTRPNDPRSRVAYGSALIRSGRVAEAEAQLSAGVALDPDNAVARVRLGSVLASQGKGDAAVEHLERALQLSPNDVDAHRFLGEIYAGRQEHAAAIAHYERVHAAYPEDPMMTVRLALLLVSARDPRVRDPRRALDLAQQAATQSRRADPRVLEVLSSAHAANGDLVTAAATAREAVPLARAMGDAGYVAALEARAAAYEKAAPTLR